MQVAQIEVDGIANGMPGHWRPDGLTLGQWLISLGYPLAGDLSQDGFRSENWTAARSADEAIQAWKGDAEHSNTMLSPDRSDIGVGIAVGKYAAGDQVYIVLITALQTSSGKMQSAADPLLTQVASSKSGAVEGSLMSQYVKPVALSTARPDGDVIHKIQYGQSLWSIAIAYHTTIDQIRAWNNLGQDTTIYEGQVLLVQKSATQPPAATLTPQASSTPLSTAIERRATSSSTATVLPASMSPGENIPSQSPAIEIRVGLILVLVASGGLIAVLLMQRRN
jgi:LysM repeat protein